MEALFSVCWDGAQAKAEACPAAEGRIQTNENVPVDADQGSDGPADFGSELAARLGTGANGRPPCVLPDAPDIAVQGGIDVSSGADPSVDPDACEVGGDGGKARGKRGVQNSWPADTSLALPQEVAKAALVVARDSLVQGARAIEVVAGVPGAAVGPETGPANSAVSFAPSMRVELPPGRMAGPAAAVAAPLSRPKHLATWALQSGTGAVEEAHARETTEGLLQARTGRTFSAEGDAVSGVPVAVREERDVVAPEVPPAAETRRPHEGDASSRKRAATLFPGAGAKDATATRAAAAAGDAPCQPVLRDEARQAGLATQRVWQGQSARGDRAASYAPPDGYAGGETVPPALTDGGTWSAAPADRGGTTGPLIVQESPGTAKPATAASARESHLGAAGPGSAEMAFSRTGSAGAYGRSPAVGIGIEIVPRDDAPAWPGQPVRRGMSGMTGGHSENPEPASEGGLTTRGAQHRADATEVPVPASAGAGPDTSAPDLPAQRVAFAAFQETRQETRLALHGRATDSVSHPSRMEGAKDGAIPVVLAEHRTDTTSASRPEGIVRPGPHAQEQAGAALEMTAHALPETHSEGGGRSRGVCVMLATASMRDQADPTDDGNDMETQGAAPGRARDAILDRAVMVRADREGEAGHGKLGVRPGSPVKATSGETLGESRVKVKAVEVGQRPDTQPRPAGEGPHGLHAGVERHPAATTRKERGGALAVDNVPAREPVVEQAAGAPEGKASGVAKPVPGCPEVSRSWSCEESTGVTAKRAAGREDAELKSARPAPAAASMHDPQEVGAGRLLASDASAAPERQAPITARTVIDQIVQRAQLRLGRSEAEMVIDLKPDVLGRVHLRITAEPGRIVAEIRAESAVTRQLIEAGLGDLKAALADRGLDLGAIAVSGGFGAGVAWNGAKSRWSDDNAGHGPPRAAPGGGGSGAMRQVASFVAARSSPGGVHLVDCVA
ncbi:MAG: flagellar hook-length control protein FliK [Bacillota bacterium]|nr:flagellar hook-length control protein FliK [Bacillota bacterium]